jgi:hypothetical protein
MYVFAGDMASSIRKRFGGFIAIVKHRGVHRARPFSAGMEPDAVLLGEDH